MNRRGFLKLAGAALGAAVARVRLPGGGAGARLPVDEAGDPITIIGTDWIGVHPAAERMSFDSEITLIDDGRPGFAPSSGDRMDFFGT